MSLNEALRDDIAALEAGVYRLLPRPDKSGRPLLYLDISGNTGVDYTQESLVCDASWSIILDAHLVPIHLLLTVSCPWLL